VNLLNQGYRPDKLTMEMTPNQLRAKQLMAKHKMCIVHDWMTVMGGAEEVLKVIHELLPVPIHVAQYNAEKLKWAQSADVRPHWISNLPLSKTKHYLYAPVLADVYRSFDLSEYDVVLSVSHTFAHHARARQDATHFGYYHTVARSLWVPEIDGRVGEGFVRKKIADRLRRLDLEAAKNFTYVTANSRTAGARVEKFYKRPLDSVLYPCVNTEKWRDTPRLDDNEGYVMWSRLIPYKKFDLAIEAAKRAGFKLHIVGSGPFEPQLKAMATGHSNIIFEGRLPDEDLKSLLSRARGVLFPAYEDFGIVPVEAMAAGLPVVVFNQGGAAETVTPEFGEHITAQTPDELVSAVARLEKKTYDPVALKTHAEKFSEERFRGELLDGIEAAIERGPNRRFIE